MAKAVAERADILPVLAEVFRAHGYEGATLALLSEASGLGKGSLYHFFPGGKQQMCAEVLAEIDGWFAANIFRPLLEGDDPEAAIAGMIAAVERYFKSGRRVCLVGVVALGAARDAFAEPVRAYFKRWAEALASALRRCGCPAATARRRAEDAMLVIQGALVIARALDDPKVFSRAMADLKGRLLVDVASTEPV
ncbi:MAG: TetR/AcrR family transcriptional regulator [Afipia sp.]|nr:TetR/AcrR family transcriptional regulator [Afipia sp.]OJW65631.1 MAG: TetR family transcriptional regulator [Afipia sp. 64-13]